MIDDKCKICALKVRFDQDKIAKELEVENFFTTLRGLQKKNIVEKGYNRRIFVSIGTDGSGDKSEMCAVNSKFFLKKNRDKKCPEFILNMESTIPDALSLNLSKKNVKLAFDIKHLTWILVVLTLALLWLGIMQWTQNAIIPELKPNKVTEHTQQSKKNGQMDQAQKPLTPIKSIPKIEAPQKRMDKGHELTSEKPPNQPHAAEPQKSGPADGHVRRLLDIGGDDD